MRKVQVIEGLSAVYNGKFWGEHNGKEREKDFGDFSTAYISHPKYCKTPTDMTYNPINSHNGNPEYDKLMKAELVRVKKTITTEFEIISINL